MSWNQNTKYQISKWVMKAESCQSLKGPPLGYPLWHSVEWRKSQTPRGGPMLHNSTGPVHIGFHVKRGPWNCIRLHLGTGISLPSAQEISGGGPHLGSLPQPSSVLKLSLWAKVRNEEPPHQTLLLESFPTWSTLSVPWPCRTPAETGSSVSHCSRVSERVSVPSQLLHPFYFSSLVEVSTEKESIYLYLGFGWLFVCFFVFVLFWWGAARRGIKFNEKR